MNKFLSHSNDAELEGDATKETSLLDSLLRTRQGGRREGDEFAGKVWERAISGEATGEPEQK